MKTEREKQLEGILRQFLTLSWAPDAAPGPNYYIVEPVNAARKAMKDAGMALDGKSPFLSDSDGAVMKIGGKMHVWFGGKCYELSGREMIPAQYKEQFEAILATMTAANNKEAIG